MILTCSLDIPCFIFVDPLFVSNLTRSSPSPLLRTRRAGLPDVSAPVCRQEKQRNVSADVSRDFTCPCNAWAAAWPRPVPVLVSVPGSMPVPMPTPSPPLPPQLILTDCLDVCSTCPRYQTGCIAYAVYLMVMVVGTAAQRISDGGSTRLNIWLLVLGCYGVATHIVPAYIARKKLRGCAFPPNPFLLPFSLWHAVFVWCPAPLPVPPLSACCALRLAPKRA